jgi:hypothetical protein
MKQVLPALLISACASLPQSQIEYNTVWSRHSGQDISKHEVAYQIDYNPVNRRVQEVRFWDQIEGGDRLNCRYFVGGQEQSGCPEGSLVLREAQEMVDKYHKKPGSGGREKKPLELKRDFLRVMLNFR